MITKVIHKLVHGLLIQSTTNTASRHCIGHLTSPLIFKGLACKLGAKLNISHFLVEQGQIQGSEVVDTQEIASLHILNE